jgi:hypothetical protein
MIVSVVGGIFTAWNCWRVLINATTKFCTSVDVESGDVESVPAV